MTTDPWTAGTGPWTAGTGEAAVTVTIKFGGGFEAPWDVQRFPDQQAAADGLRAAYDIDPEGDLDWPTLLAEAAAKAQGIWAVKNELGATVTRGGRGGWAGKGAQKAQKAPESADEKTGEQILLDKIAELQTADEAKAWGTANKANLTKIPAAVAAFKAKMATLGNGNAPAAEAPATPPVAEPKAEPVAEPVTMAAKVEAPMLEQIGELASLADAQAWGRANKPALLKDPAAVEAFRSKMTTLKEAAA